MRIIKPLCGVVVMAAVGGCSSSSPDEQVIRGQAALTSFPTQVSEVRALRGSEVAAVTTIGRDGTFSVTLPVGNGYQLVFAGDNHVPLVFPRSAGAIDTRFDIHAGGKAFDLGGVRYVGDPSVQAFAFNQVSSDQADADDIECEDGIDANTGAVCVDDDDEEGAGACQASEVDDGDSVDCEDGIDAATGLECDGGPAANSDGAGDDAEGEVDVPTEAAVADHNLPAAMGCEEEDGDDHDCEDGIDPATGLECDGGPDAQGDDGE